MEEALDTGIAGAPADGNLSLSSASIHFLKETGKWGRFLAILGFIFIAVMVAVGLMASTLFGQIPGMQYPGLIGAIYVLMALLYFFPVLYLFNFSSRINRALQHRDNISLEDAFQNLKSLYKFMGICAIVVLAFYVVFGGIALVVFSMRH